MKDVVLHILEEDELPFWRIGGIEVTVKGFEQFNETDKQFLEDLLTWLKGENE